MSQILVTGEAKIRDIQGPVVANSGVITALDGAASQYVRGDGTLADFPTSTGGGSSVSYYLNSSVSQGTIGGVAYRELSKEPIIGAGTDIAIAANGYVASYLTDANDPDVLSIPGGNFNCEFYFSVSNDTGNPFFYAELYKYDGTTFTLLGSSVGVPEYINQGTIIAPYYFAIPVPTSALAVTDRLAIRIYVNVDGRTVTLHTENSHLCQVVTTLSKGMVSLNNLTDQSQYLTTGTSGTDFNIVSSGDTHTFNLPIASAANTGKLSSTDWSTFNNKQAALSFTAPLVNTSNTISIPAATSLVDGYLDNLDWTNFNTAYNNMIVSAAVTGTTTKTLTLTQQDAGTITASWTDDNTDAVTSVFGRTGAVVAQSGDYNTSQVTENTNLYFTDARSRAALSFTAGSGAYNSTTGLITIPTNNNQITNGSNFITLTSLSAGTGISYNNTTGVITNSAPDQTVSLTAGAGISISGTYPSFTIASTITQYTDTLARAAISLTTTGTSGAATYNSTTGVFNIPNYAPDLSGYVPTSRTITINGTSFDLSANRSYSVGTVTSVGLSSATSGVTIGSTPITTSGTITLAIATASGSQNGLLSSTDWTTFNNKQNALTNPVTGTGTTNYLPKFTGASTIGNSTIQDDGSSILIGRETFITGTTAYFQVGNGGAGTGKFQIEASSGSAIIGTRDASSIAFRTNLTTRMTLDTSGNLGIGTTSPSYKLDVRGSSGAYWNGSTYTGGTPLAISITNTEVGGYDPVLIFQQTDSGGTSKNSGGIGIVGRSSWTSGNNSTQISDMYFLVRNDNGGISERMRLTSTGNLGLGTTSPSYRLHVQSTSGTIARITDGTNNLDFYAGSSLNEIAATTTMLFSTNNAERMRITSGGSVGIGTSSPDTALQAIGGISARTNTTGDAFYRLYLDSSIVGHWYADRAGSKLNIGSVTSIPLVLETGGTERMRITSGGNVLINTTTDAGYELYVNGGSTNGALFYSTSAANQIKAAGTAPAITFTNTITSPTIGGVLGAATTANQFVTGTVAGDVALINQYTGALVFGTVTERMRISSGGNVAIGRTDDRGYRLSVQNVNATPINVNRTQSDGGLIDFEQDGALEGNISVSGNTVSYNSFLGSHWSQLKDGSKTEILKGTILEAIDEMCIWEGETNDRLPKSKISDTINSKNVYGVFLAWDENWKTSNDFYVAAVGLGYIRVNSSQNISMGDLLQSNGDGTAKIQEDDIMRSSTIAKVVSTNKITTYEDGSYLIAATLHCG